MKKLIRIETDTRSYEIPKSAKKVAFDGCHKFYICETEDDVKMMTEYGYERILDINMLADLFNCTTCDLRFINTAQLSSVVEQFENAVFYFSDGSTLETEFYEESEDEEWEDDEDEDDEVDDWDDEVDDW